MYKLFFLFISINLFAQTNAKIENRYLAQKGLINLEQAKFQFPHLDLSGTGIKIAVIDSGVNTTHKQLSNAIDIFSSYDMIKNSPLQTDENGHGTHVAGVINQVVPNARIMAIKVLNKAGQGSVENIIKGIKFAVDHGAHIINLSLGGVDPNNLTKPNYEEAINYARKKNVLVVAAAGNNSSNNDVIPFYPANIWNDNLISVCAMDLNFRLAEFSNYGKQSVHLCAPGVKITSSIGAENFQALNGTSQGAPFVTAAAAIFKSLNKNLSPAQIKNLLMSGAQKIDALKETSQTGGMLNIYFSLLLF